MPQDVVKLDVIDFVGGLRCEAFLNNRVLLVAQLHPEVVEDGAEAREVDEAAPAPVLVLEVRFDQKATVLHVGTQAHQAGNQNLFFVVVEDVLGVQD